jgi:N-acetylmuramic acid 6-phosphate etherase
MRLHEMSAGECVRLMAAEDRAVLEAMDAAAPSITAFLEAFEPGFVAGGRLIYVGAGTSGRLGVLDASEAPPTFCLTPDRIIGIIAGGDSALRLSGEAKEDDPLGAAPELDALKLGPNDAVLGIAAGGTTPYPNGALEYVKRLARPPITALLTCSPVPKPAACDHLIVLATGPEVLTGSTRMKAGTATKLALNTISTTLMIRTGRVYENLMVDLRASNIKLRDRAARILSQILGRPREACFEILDQADGSVKLAIVMQRLSLGKAEAQAQLDAHGGRLDAALRGGS